MAKERIAEAVKNALESAMRDGEVRRIAVPVIEVEVPRNREHGDFSTNIAMTLAREAQMPPRQLAEVLAARLQSDGAPSRLIQKVEVAGPGFINFHLSPSWLHDTLVEIERRGDSYGSSDAAKGVKALLEFVSANPNGPITVGSARGGVIGDTLARLYQLMGAKVVREYYINDAANSTQMINFGKSLVVRYLQELGVEAHMPEDGYQGAYVTDIARKIVARDGDRYLDMPEDERLTLFTRMAEEEMIATQKADLAAFGIEFDRWFSERSLHESGKVAATIEKLKELGCAYEKDGALWLKSTDFGDDKDRALLRSNGAPTYIAADAAYHADKFDRGFNRLINVWGPDHHGYIARTKAAVAALGYPAEALDIIIYQAVRLFSGGELVMMSKRAGDVISLAELMQEVGRDAARFFLLMRSHDSQLDFDLELARSQSDENPVYYVQYAHARICSLLRNADEKGFAVPPAEAAKLELLTHPSEIELMKKLADWPDEVVRAGLEREPHRLAAFAMDMARLFHKFYTDCRVMDEADRELSGARLVLVRSCRTVLGNLLRTMGVTAPERM